MIKHSTTQHIEITKNIGIGGNSPLALIAGPCVIESKNLILETAAQIKEIAEKYNVPYIFKSSFDKANRTSINSFRGPGLEKGLEILAELKEICNLPILTDIHHPEQAIRVAEVADVLQIPAFLCRQTDLLIAAGETGKAINIKKGQFMDAEGMRYAIEKVFSTGNKKVFLTERGTTFGYNNLVVDMRNLPKMRNLGVPVVYDGTHSVQQPGGAGNKSGGTREFVPHLTRAAVAIGVDALFLEVHPNPDAGLCDAANMIDYKTLKEILSFVQQIQALEIAS